MQKLVEKMEMREEIERKAVVEFLEFLMKYDLNIVGRYTRSVHSHLGCYHTFFAERGVEERSTKKLVESRGFKDLMAGER